MLNRSATVEALRQAGIVAVVRTTNVEQAVHAVRALAAGGVLASEVTFTVPNAADAIAQVRDLHAKGDLPERLVLGAGTVTSAQQARQAIEAGARYLVSPHFDEAVAQVADEAGGALLPGAFTPLEVFRAHRHGGDIIKIFPAANLGPSYLKNLAGPYPDIPLMPTGGVSVENIREWIAAGAVAVGVGSELVDKAAVAKGDWNEITRRAVALVDALREARGE